MAAPAVITRDEARQAAAMLATCDGEEQVHGAMVAAAKLEYGRWTEDVAYQVLEARLGLDRAIESAGVGA